MGLFQELRDQGRGTEKHNPAGFKLSFDTAPDNVILQETIVGEVFHNCSTFLIGG
jgi:hypothetical protein